MIMAKKVISQKEVSEMMSEFLHIIPVCEGYVWDVDFGFDINDQENPVVITLKLRKINI